MQDYIIYHTATGKILQTMNTFEEWMDDFILSLPEYSFIIGKCDDLQRFYVNADTLTERPALSYTVSKTTIDADATDIALISGIPSSATICLNGTEQTADGSDIEFVTDIVGEHTLQIILWPYQDAEVTINAI